MTGATSSRSLRATTSKSLVAMASGSASQVGSNMISAHIGIILVVTGAATAMAIIRFIAPSSVLRMVSGVAPADTVSMALARHWGLLILLIGILLIYAAFRPAVRDPAMVVAVVEKLVLGAGVLGTCLRSWPIATAPHSWCAMSGQGVSRRTTHPTLRLRTVHFRFRLPDQLRQPVRPERQNRLPAGWR